MKQLIATLSLCVLAQASVAETPKTLDLNSLSEAVNSTQAGASQASGLMSSLTDQLGISQTQAAGGTSALMALASNALSDDNAAMLKDIIPSSGGAAGGLASSLMGSITSMDGVASAFSQLGLDPAMIEQFTPILMDYVGKNGGSDLLGQLSSIWGG
ncbi:DUF2780 domain-containing protein [Gilvimarinus agarilyticus]|uniref:DUF2780 domain-containing protein n=1 Tax=Gilvimarinus agarilyticus TaxID=679259 RepID=UPI0006989FB6|nr:DUF2780 domain-containing protein [Gilvimarinus agarilyticus]